MLARAIALALLTAAVVLPASAANTAYDRAASMAAGETALARGYDGTNAAGTVRASINGTPNSGGLVTPGSPRASLTHATKDASSVPAPDRARMFEVAGAAAGAVAGGALAGPIGALFGAALGFGIALMLSKLLS
ncbi:MAG: hypothetical protein AAB262_11795 [Elusimicrobiota bacterium]